MRVPSSVPLLPICYFLFAISSAFPAAAAPADIGPNDNTRPAGRLDGRRLTVGLVASTGTFAPEGPHVAAYQVAAFGEEGQPLSAPGPLLRVKAGTQIAITLRNALTRDLTVHGLCDRRGPCADVALAAGATRTVTFTAATPGLYGYWAASGSATLDHRIFADSQLGGAFVVDPTEGAPPD